MSKEHISTCHGGHIGSAPCRPLHFAGVTEQPTVLAPLAAGQPSRLCVRCGHLDSSARGINGSIARLGDRSQPSCQRVPGSNLLLHRMFICANDMSAFFSSQPETCNRQKVGSLGRCRGGMPRRGDLEYRVLPEDAADRLSNSQIDNYLYVPPGYTILLSCVVRDMIK